MKQPLLNYLFVYGTLRKAANGKLHPYLRNRAVFIDRASLPGKLFHIDRYPGAISAPAEGGCRVHGEVYRLLRPEQTLATLDEYEECATHFPEPHEYQRITGTVTLNDGKNLQAWIYWYHRPITGHQRIGSGDYFDYLITTTTKP